MMGVTHISFGALVVGVVGACLGEPVLGAVVGGIGAALPDIDHPGSLIGRRIKPLSVLLFELFGHRGLIHTVWAAIIFSSFLSILTAASVTYSGFSELLSINSIHIFTYLFLGFVSHLILDSFTPSGIRPWLPFILNGYFARFNEFRGKIITGSSTEGIIAGVCTLIILVGVMVRLC
jgi:inner membrane protein